MGTPHPDFAPIASIQSTQYGLTARALLARCIALLMLSSTSSLSSPHSSKVPFFANIYGPTPSSRPPVAVTLSVLIHNITWPEWKSSPSIEIAVCAPSHWKLACLRLKVSQALASLLFYLFLPTPPASPCLSTSFCAPSVCRYCSASLYVISYSYNGCRLGLLVERRRSG